MTSESKRQAGARAPITAIVLAAGMGTRLAPITQSRPKCLVPVCGRPILAHALDVLRHHRVRHVVITIGYLGNQIRDHVAKRPDDIDATFVRNDAYASTGSLESLRLALERAPRDRDILLIEGDVVFERDLLGWLLEGAHGETAATMLEPYAPHLSGTLALMGADDYVTDVVHEKVRPSDFPLRRSYKTTNISLFSAAARELLDATVRTSLERHGAAAPLEHALRELVGAGARIRGIATGGRKWYEIDTPDDLAAAERMFGELLPCAAYSAS